MVVVRGVVVSDVIRTKGDVIVVVVSAKWVCDCAESRCGVCWRMWMIRWLKWLWVWILLAVFVDEVVVADRCGCSDHGYSGGCGCGCENI